jgi:hypothetical protein
MHSSLQQHDAFPPPGYALTASPPRVAPNGGMGASATAVGQPRNRRSVVHGRHLSHECATRSGRLSLGFRPPQDVEIRRDKTLIKEKSATYCDLLPIRAAGCD